MTMSILRAPASKTVFDQFFHHRRGTLHDFARCNLAREDISGSNGIQPILSDCKSKVHGVCEKNPIVATLPQRAVPSF